MLKHCGVVTSPQAHNFMLMAALSWIMGQVGLASCCDRHKFERQAAAGKSENRGWVRVAGPKVDCHGLTYDCGFLCT